MPSSFDRKFTMRASDAIETMAGGPEHGEHAIEDGLFVPREPPLTRTLHVLGACLRASGLFLLASPLLFVVKLVLAATAGPAASDIVIPFFAIVVVFFFGTLNVAIILFMVRWAMRKRLPPRRFAPTALAEGGAPTTATRVGETVRARGRAVALDGDAADVLLEAREKDDVRLVAMRFFAVVADDPEVPAVVVHGGRAPLPTQVPLEIRAGDRVEVSGVVDAVFANGDHIVLGDVEAALARPPDDDPYRGAAPRMAISIAATHAPATRVVVEKCG